MVSKLPLPEKMTPEDRERMKELQNKPDEIVEGERENGEVCDSLEELLSSPAAGGVRYATVPIVGLPKPVRFRSLLTEEWLAVREGEETNILEYALCDAKGRKFMDAAGVKRLKEKFDARTYAHLVEEANEHCFCGLSLDKMREAALGNSQATGTTATS